MTCLENIYNVFDARDAARRILPKGVFDFIDRGAEDDETIRTNREGYRRLKLQPHALVDVSARSTVSELFGRKMGMPLAIAPTGAAGLVRFQGEMALAKAAAEAEIPFSLATRSMSSLEETVRLGGRLWFQLYLWKDRQKSYELIERVSRAGIEALIVTVDVAVHANREFNKRNGFTFPFTPSFRAYKDMLLHPKWLTSVVGKYYLNGGMPSYNHPGIADNVSWDDIREIRKRWPRTLLVKGILRGEDALSAIQCGADGVIVSNHGGRALDAAVATIDALPEVVSAIRHRGTVLMDSGIRRGTDIAKALSLGAAAVLSGRPCLFGLAVGGQAGASKILSIFHHELMTTLGQVGCPSVAQLGPHVIFDAARSNRVQPLASIAAA